MQDDIAALHAFWFGPLDETGFCADSQDGLWFHKSVATDNRIRDRFGHLVTQALAGALDHWRDSDRGLVALIVLLDQFTRNIYRGTARAFAGDPHALALAQACIASGRHRRLPGIHRVFLYLPLEHCEDPRVQADCVALFEELVAASGHPQLPGFLRYAIAHREVIDRFGRFPHRNAVLGRDTTPAEATYLERHGGF